MMGLWNKKTNKQKNRMRYMTKCCLCKLKIQNSPIRKWATDVTLRRR